MEVVKEQFVVDEGGHRTAALVGIDRYLELINAEEELACVRAFDNAKTSGDEAIPLAQALKEIEADRV
jgi:hypothetical protein